MSWVFRSVPLCAVLVLLFMGASAADRSRSHSGVDGRLVSGGEPVAGGQVSAYRTIDIDGDIDGEPAVVSPLSRADGRYSLDLEPGTYFLTASAGDMWNWCGQNPVTITGKERPWIGFVLTAWRRPVIRESGEAAVKGRLHGRVLLDGEPLAEATVSLYFDEMDGFRGMGFMRTPPTGPDGVYTMDLIPEGSYYLIARKRVSGKGVGPMVKGDLISWYRFNPVRIEEGKDVEIILPMTAKRLDRQAHAAGAGHNGTGFGGFVTNAGGQPVEGLHVFAYRKPEMGHHKPAALSTITDSRGRYEIHLPDSGRYYVGVREGYGDNPSPGEMFGHYEGTPDHSLVLKDGQFLKNINMVVRKVLAP